jgi:hypothetical protein
MEAVNMFRNNAINRCLWHTASDTSRDTDIGLLVSARQLILRGYAQEHLTYRTRQHNPDYAIRYGGDNVAYLCYVALVSFVRSTNPAAANSRRNYTECELKKTSHTDSSLQGLFWYNELVLLYLALELAVRLCKNWYPTNVCRMLGWLYRDYGE